MYKLIGYSLPNKDFIALSALAREKDSQLKKSEKFVKAPFRRKLKLIKKEIQRTYSLFESKFLSFKEVRDHVCPVPINYFVPLSRVEYTLCDIFLTSLGLESQETHWIDYLLSQKYTNKQLVYITKIARKRGLFLRLEELFYANRDNIPIYLIPLRYSGQSVKLEDFYKGVAFAREILTNK
jgi:hypothetical protein